MDSSLLKASGVGGGSLGQESGKEKLRADLDGMVSDAGDMLKEAANSSVEKLSVAREQVKGKLNEAKAQLAQAGTAVKGGAKQAADATSEYVKENPWKSIGVAAVAALLVGFFFSRR